MRTDGRDLVSGMAVVCIDNFHLDGSDVFVPKGESYLSNNCGHTRYYSKLQVGSKCFYLVIVTLALINAYIISSTLDEIDNGMEIDVLTSIIIRHSQIVIHPLPQQSKMRLVLKLSQHLEHTARRLTCIEGTMRLFF